MGAKAGQDGGVLGPRGGGRGHGRAGDRGLKGHSGGLEGNPALCLQMYEPERCGKFFENRIGAL